MVYKTSNMFFIKTEYVEAAYLWCRDENETSGWDMRTGPAANGKYFCFKNDEDAIMFKLVWCGK